MYLAEAEAEISFGRRKLQKLLIIIVLFMQLWTQEQLALPAGRKKHKGITIIPQ